MRMEREQHLGAGHYERSGDRQGYANGYQPKKVDTPAGNTKVQVPKTRETAEPFYPQPLERGRRASRAVMLALAEMYVQGASTRDAAKVMAEFGLESLSSTQVSRAEALLDGELEAWRSRSLGQTRYLVLDARNEKVRDGGIVRDAAILSAIGIGPDGRRRPLGVSAALSEAEVHWPEFLDALVARGMRGVEFIVRDDHPGLRAARRQCSPGPSGSAASFIWPRTPSIMRRTLRSGSASEPNCAPSGTPTISTPPGPNWIASSGNTRKLRQSSRNGWRPMFRRASPSSRCPSITAAGCGHRSPIAPSA